MIYQNEVVSGFQYELCLLQSFNSRAALNGHIRIHGGGVCGRSPTPDKRLSTTPIHIGHTDPVEEFPCKICGK